MAWRPVIAVAAVAVGVAGCGRSDTHSSNSGSSSSGRPQIVYGSFHSAALKGTAHYSIALPPGYRSGGLRYPVIYFLHGLPASPNAYEGIGVYADSLASTGHRVIVVGAEGTRPGDTDDEWHNWGPGRNWDTATGSELVHWIDSHYRTLARRSARGIVGVSAGGYGATLIGIHHPGTYAVIESWSGYFEPTNLAGQPEDLGSEEENSRASAHASIPQLKQKFAPYGPTYFGFYIGTKDPYPGFVADNERLDRELNEAGIPHSFALYEGAHDASFWRSHQDEWLAAAAARLDRPTAVR